MRRFNIGCICGLLLRRCGHRLITLRGWWTTQMSSLVHVLQKTFNQCDHFPFRGGSWFLCSASISISFHLAKCVNCCDISRTSWSRIALSLPLLTRGMARVGATEDSAPRKGSSERSSPWVNDRSQSPRLRSRPTSLSPLLGDPSGARESHSPALIFALTYCVGYTVVLQVPLSLPSCP